VVGVTNPDGNVVTFWDLARQRFVKRLELPAPRGLTKTLDEEYLVLSYGAGTLTLVEPSTLEPVSFRRVDKSTGDALRLSHLQLGPGGGLAPSRLRTAASRRAPRSYRREEAEGDAFEGGYEESRRRTCRILRCGQHHPFASAWVLVVFGRAIGG